MRAPDSFAQTPDGLLLIANGVDPVKRWDALQAAPVTAGVAPPATAPALAASGSGALVGTYYGFLRFVDERGNPSNLSPLSNQLSAQHGTGTITAVTNATPVVVASAGHGLSTGATVKLDGIQGPTGLNQTWTITVVDADHFSLNDSVAAGTYQTGGTWLSGTSTITYTAVAVPSDSKITRRQLLRNTDGQATTFYVDVDTTDLVSSTLTSTQTDSQLAAGEAVPLFDADGKVFANRYGVPPAHKAAPVHHQGRMFYAAEVTYTAGSVRVTNGSVSVQGYNTGWPVSFVGRTFYTAAGGQAYTIAAVDTTAQRLTLATAYSGLNDKFASYAIRPEAAERRLVYYSEAGLPEAVPVTNAFPIQEDNDEITGGLAKGSFVYVLERRHVYRMTFQTDPAIDGGVFLAAVRGCINNRCHVTVEDLTYMLDDAGVHAFDGSGGTQPVSGPVQDLFRPSADTTIRINWKAAAYFHAAHYPNQETIRWFLSTGGDYLPRTALVYNYRLQRWWTESYPVPIASSATGLLGNTPVVYVGTDAGRTLALWQGALDGVDPADGDVRGDVTAATPMSLTDTAATWPTRRLVGSPVALVSGRGQGQIRRVVAVSGQTLRIDRPWAELPDTTTVYQLGGINWTYRSGTFHYFDGTDYLTPTRVELLWKPVTYAAEVHLRVLEDLGLTPMVFAVSYDRDATEVTGTAGLDYVVYHLDDPKGHAYKRMDRHRESLAEGPHFVTIELRGVSSSESLIVYGLTFDGVDQPGGG